jgi:3-oxoacyl-[acyl-carrier protein] reductase
LTDRRRAAIVTGGASGIGLNIVCRLARADLDVVAVDWSDELCSAARIEVSEFSGHVVVIQSDIGTPEGVARAIGTVIERFGQIDLLCNNAAVHPMGSIEELDLHQWREAFRVNVDGTMLCCQAALPHMKRRRSGVIINMGSVSATLPYARGGAYAATKAAVVQLTKVLALEAGPHGVRANCISAGSIVHRHDPGTSAPSYIPMGRFGRPDDVSSLVLFLASDEASYINGTEIIVDGGATAGRERRSSR